MLIQKFYSYYFEMNTEELKGSILQFCMKQL